MRKLPTASFKRKFEAAEEQIAALKQQLEDTRCDSKTEFKAMKTELKNQLATIDSLQTLNNHFCADICAKEEQLKEYQEIERSEKPKASKGKATATAVENLPQSPQALINNNNNCKIKLMVNIHFFRKFIRRPSARIYGKAGPINSGLQLLDDTADGR